MNVSTPRFHSLGNISVLQRIAKIRAKTEEHASGQTFATALSTSSDPRVNMQLAASPRAETVVHALEARASVLQATQDDSAKLVRCALRQH